MKLLTLYISVVLSCVTLASCEDLIDVDLNEANPKLIIEADLNNLTSTQLIRIAKTVAFDSPVGDQPVVGAMVSVVDSKGRRFDFSDSGKGEYRRNNFKPEEDLNYSLSVTIDNETFTASTKMSKFVAIDSLAVMEETVFNETYYSAVLKFEDPKDVANYYKYDISVNGKPYKFAFAFSDKFNDGLYVTHQVSDKERSLAIGDSIVVRRQCLAKEVYNFWNEIQLLNPGSAAPANPTSNISNGALGYFSVCSAKEYGLRIVSPKE